MADIIVMALEVYENGVIRTGSVFSVPFLVAHPESSGFDYVKSERDRNRLFVG
jgi:hypothetical protein